jgi:hypothetical protein
MAYVKRSAILKAIIARLKTITIANGYSKDIKDVTLDIEPVHEKMDYELPIIYLLPDNERGDAGVGGLVTRTWTIDFLIAARNVDYDQMLDLCDDVEGCLLGFKTNGDHTLGCTISLPRVIDLAIQGQMESDKDNIYQALITIEFEYRNTVFRK